ncbi:unnamed protein product [Heterobilharzia americana]|nr:unnamed protein product [Heterobilharzia americana]
MMCFEPSKCKVLMQAWQEPMPALSLSCEPLEVVETFMYLGSCPNASGGVSDDIPNRISKERAAYINLGQLSCRHDVGLTIKDQEYNISARAVLIDAYET